jgi:hypothetical protein
VTTRDVLHIVWEFRPAVHRRAEFERAYGPAGGWVRLFSSAPGYLETFLGRFSQTRDASPPR